MKILSDHILLPKGQRTVLTMGMFDGVHRGHREIIHLINAIAGQKNQHSCLLTFWPHPRMVLQKNSSIRLLTTQSEKMKLLENTGLEYVFVKDFTQEFSQVDSVRFVKEFLVKTLNISTLVIGHDHHFGKNREGNFEALRRLSDEFDFEVIRLDAVKEENRPISSTKIRNALLQGNTDFANDALGYCYPITGKVVHGDKIGRTIGFPTVNLQTDPHKLLPADGVYGVRLSLNGIQHFGLLNIGVRPTFAGMEKRVEIYILDYQGDLYDTEIHSELLFHIRSEMKFNNKEELAAQIIKDEDSFRNKIKLSGC